MTSVESPAAAAVLPLFLPPPLPRLPTTHFRTQLQCVLSEHQCKESRCSPSSLPLLIQTSPLLVFLAFLTVAACVWKRVSWSPVRTLPTAIHCHQLPFPLWRTINCPSIVTVCEDFCEVFILSSLFKLRTETCTHIHTHLHNHHMRTCCTYPTHTTCSMYYVLCIEHRYVYAYATCTCRSTSCTHTWPHLMCIHMHSHITHSTGKHTCAHIHIAHAHAHAYTHHTHHTHHTHTTHTTHTHTHTMYMRKHNMHTLHVLNKQKCCQYRQI